MQETSLRRQAGLRHRLDVIVETADRFACFVQPQRAIAVACAASFGLIGATGVPAAPALRDPGLQVTAVVTGLTQPTSMAFIGPNNDFLILEKATGRVMRVTNGALVATMLDLPVNSNSERGLLGITLDAILFR